MVRVAVALLLLVLLVQMPWPAHTQPQAGRVALLIGNQNYPKEVGRLANPHNDVALLERSLKGLGFDVVVVRDAGLAPLHHAVNAYARRVRAAGAKAVGFFYYSGHGAADAGTNYLVPTDAKTTETGELWDQSLRLAGDHAQIEERGGERNAFRGVRCVPQHAEANEGGSRGLVQPKGFVPIVQESGMLIAYATAEGELASDVGAGAGPYAKVLAEEIVQARCRGGQHVSPRPGASPLDNRAGTLAWFQCAGRGLFCGSPCQGAGAALGRRPGEEGCAGTA